jgi:DNA-binding XRE family transcriptional regulator
MGMITKKDKRVGKGVKKFRKQTKMTQEQLAERVRLSTKYIQFIESGQRVPSLKTVYRIAKALGVKVQDLFPF